MSHIGEQIREWEVEEPSIIPEREQEIESDPEPETIPQVVPEKEEEKVGV